MCLGTEGWDSHMRADDPTWWPEGVRALVEGTRLGAATEHHLRALGRMSAWRDRLFQLYG